MIHSNVRSDRRPKARLVATGEIIRKNGKRDKIVLSDDPNITNEEVKELFPDSLDETTTENNTKE